MTESVITFWGIINKKKTNFGIFRCIINKKKTDISALPVDKTKTEFESLAVVLVTKR